MNTSIDGTNRYQLLALPLSCTRGSTVSFSVLHFDLALFALAEFRPCLLVLFNSICCVTLIYRLVRRDFWGTLFNGGPKAGHLWGVSSHTNSKFLRFFNLSIAVCFVFVFASLHLFLLAALFFCLSFSSLHLHFCASYCHHYMTLTGGPFSRPCLTPLNPRNRSAHLLANVVSMPVFSNSQKPSVKSFQSLKSTCAFLSACPMRCNVCQAIHSRKGWMPEALRRVPYHAIAIIKGKVLRERLPSSCT